MKYGDLPIELGQYKVDCKEMMFYQYLPIKLVGQTEPRIENRLNCFSDLIGIICCDFIGKNGLDEYVNSYVYLTAKYMYQMSGCSFNRMGYHSDGFMTDDINYVWCDKNPTTFNTTEFKLTPNDELSLLEMDDQAKKEKEYFYPDNSLLRLNQYNIHKVAERTQPGMRTFLKISFSQDKYDLIGNAHNYLLDYDWRMKQRKDQRNIPQTEINNQ